MGELYTYNGVTHLTIVREGGTEFTQSAELGGADSGRFVMDDTAGTQAIVGQKDFAHTESSCANPLTFRGFIAPRVYGRAPSQERAPNVGTARGIAVELEGLNSMLGHRMLRDHGTTAAQNGKRPSETVAERIEWLLGNHAMALIADNGRVDAPTDKIMDKADYRKQFPGDVLTDCALAAGGYNYYVADFGSGPELVFRDDNASTDDSSALRISSVSTDIDSDPDTLGANKTFGPSRDFTLRRDPGRVRSVLAYDHAKGTVTEQRTATATTFNGERAGSASNSNIKTDAKAREDAQAMLAQLSTEEDILEGEITVPASAVNLVRAGERIQVKLEYLTTEGYGSFTWCRVLETRKRPIVADGGIWTVGLKLSPQEAAVPVATGGIVQSTFGRVAGGGGTATLPNAVTVGNLLVFATGDRVSTEPHGPNTGPDLPRFGAGAWTRLPDNEASAGSDGCAIWVKEADSTENAGFIALSDANYGVWEIAITDYAATIAAATTVFETQQAANLTMDIGSLGTAATGTVGIFVLIWDDGTTVIEGPEMPAVAADGWTIRLYDSSFESGWILENHPYTVIADALGDGSTLDATVVKNPMGHRTGVWAGAAILIDPQ